MKKNKFSNYQESLSELQGLVDQLQSEEVSIDDLAEKIARAKELIGFCREKLHHTEVAIDQLLGEE